MVKPSGPSGQILSQFLQHEVTRSMPPPLDGMPIHQKGTPSILTL